jgi:hypothetical protein
MSKNQKVCLVYKDSDGEVARTRFFKPTSKEVIKRQKKVLIDAGKKPELMKRAVWEFEQGPINGEASKPAQHRDLRFIEKTHEMKNGQYKQNRQTGQPLAY